MKPIINLIKSALNLIKSIHPLVATIVALGGLILFFYPLKQGELSLLINGQEFKDFKSYSTEKIVEYKKVLNDKDTNIVISLPILENTSSYAINNCDITVTYENTYSFSPVENNYFFVKDSTLTFKEQVIKPFQKITLDFNYFMSKRIVHTFHCDYRISYEGISTPMLLSYDLFFVNKKQYRLNSLVTYMSLARRDYANQNIILSCKDTAVFIPSSTSAHTFGFLKRKNEISWNNDSYTKNNNTLKAFFLSMIGICFVFLFISIKQIFKKVRTAERYVSVIDGFRIFFWLFAIFVYWMYYLFFAQF